ncbi:hypothetical protein DRQ53_06525 [bacterium]|nr:MAG: hypothetical protein DRQ53_06525 [bacterium]
MNKAFLALCWAVALAAIVSTASAHNGPGKHGHTEPATEAATEAEPQAQSPADVSADRVGSIRPNDYFYQSWGRPDLFSALVSGEFEPGEAADLVDVNNAQLVGVMWGPTDQFALVEDGSGNGYILRVGDRVANGRVLAVQNKSLVASVSLYGITNRVILRLDDGKDER